MSNFVWVMGSLATGIMCIIVYYLTEKGIADRKKVTSAIDKYMVLCKVCRKEFYSEYTLHNDVCPLCEPDPKPRRNKYVWKQIQESSK